MAERAVRPMTLEEFLAWDDGTATRYELIDGVPVAMNPPIADHGTIVANVVGVISRAVAGRRPCRAIAGAGVRLPDGRPANCPIPDVVMTCEPVDRRQLVGSPRLIVEVLSPSTESYDHTTKVPLYGEVDSVEEIWLVGAKHRLVTVYERRDGEWRAGLPRIGRATFASRALACEVALDAIYELTLLEAEP